MKLRVVQSSFHHVFSDNFRILSIGTISSPAATGIVDVGADTGALLAAMV